MGALLIVAVSDRTDGEVFNLGNQPVSLLKLTELLLKITQRGSYKLVPFPQERKKIDIGSGYCSYQKIKKILGWQPTISLQDGLERTVKFYEKNKKYYFSI